MSIIPPQFSRTSMTVKYFFALVFLLTLLVALNAQWGSEKDRYHNNQRYGYQGNTGYRGYNAEPRKVKNVYYGYASVANYNKPTDYGFESIYTNRNPYIDRDYLAYRKGYRKDGINIGYHDAQDVLRNKDQRQTFHVAPEFHNKFKIAYQQAKATPYKDTKHQQSSYRPSSKDKPADKTYHQVSYTGNSNYKDDKKDFKHAGKLAGNKQSDVKYKQHNEYEKDQKAPEIKYKEESYSNFQNYDNRKPYINVVLERNGDQGRKQYGRIRHEDYKPRYSAYRYRYYRNYP